MFFFLLIRRPPRSTRTDTLFPYTTRFRSIMALLWQRAHGEYWMSAPNRLRFVAFSLAVIAGPRKTMPPGRHFMTSTDQRPAGLRELTLRGIILGGLITLLFTAANVYLELGRASCRERECQSV